jgi:hypothetical protein
MGVARIQFYLSIPSWLLLATLPSGGPYPAGTAQSAGVFQDLGRQHAPTTQIILTLSAKQEPVINGQPVHGNNWINRCGLSMTCALARC